MRESTTLASTKRHIWRVHGAFEGTEGKRTTHTYTYTQTISITEVKPCQFAVSISLHHHHLITYSQFRRLLLPLTDLRLFHILRQP